MADPAPLAPLGDAVWLEAGGPSPRDLQRASAAAALGDLAPAAAPIAPHAMATESGRATRPQLAQETRRGPGTLRGRDTPRGGPTLSTGRTQPIKVVEPQRGDTVLSRARPEFDPLGVRLGAFEVFPSLGVEERFSDNIFRTDSNTTYDFITTLRPSLLIRSDWSVHEISLQADSDIGIYARNPAENYEDARFGVGGRLDIYSDAYLAANASFQKLHEDRGSPDDVGGTSPTDYNVKSANLEYSHRFGNLTANLDGQVESINYIDSDAVVAGVMTEINNDDRDRNIYTTSGTLTYEFLPDTAAFVRGTGNWRDYKSGMDDAGFDRDSQGVGGDLGISADLGGLVFGEAFVGYRTQDYEDPMLPTISGLNLGADVTWNVTPLTTVVFGVTRTIEETTIAGTSGFYANRAALSVDHELLRNLLVFLDVSFQRNDYEGIDRSDDLVTASAEARYLVSRNVYLSGGYRYSMRDSDVAGGDFTENAVLGRVTLQY